MKKIFLKIASYGFVYALSLLFVFGGWAVVDTTFEGDGFGMDDLVLCLFFSIFPALYFFKPVRKVKQTS